MKIEVDTENLTEDDGQILFDLLIRRFNPWATAEGADGKSVSIRNLQAVCGPACLLQGDFFEE